MAQALYKNVGSQSIAVFVYKASDGTPFTGAASTITLKVSKDKASGATLNQNSGHPIGNPDGTNGLADGSGIYFANLDQDETNADLLIFYGTCSTSGYVVEPIAMNTVASGTTLFDGVSAAMPAAGTALASLTFRERLMELTQRFLGETEFDGTYIRIKDNSGTDIHKQTYTGATAAAKSIGAVAAP